MRIRFVLPAFLLLLSVVFSTGMATGEVHPAPAGGKTIVGEVEAINLSQATVSIRESAPGNATKKTQLLRVTLRVDAGTVLVKGKDTPITLREMKPSDRVLARYAEGGSGLRALMIRVAGVAAEATPAPVPSP